MKHSLVFAWIIGGTTAGWQTFVFLKMILSPDHAVIQWEPLVPLLYGEFLVTLIGWFFLLYYTPEIMRAGKGTA